MSVQHRIDDAITALQAAKLELRHLLEQPSWYATALGEIGVREIVGAQHEARILEYHSVTRGPGSHRDETPWCASFACWCLSRSGLGHPATKKARVFEGYGVELEEPRLGCIVVLSRGPNPAHGHVAFYHDTDEQGRLVLLGGNQRNAVRLATYDPDRLLSYRWPPIGTRAA